MHGEIAGLVMAHGDCGALGHEQEGDRLANDVGMADDHHFETGKIEACRLEDVDRRHRRAGTEVEFVVDDVADGCGMQALHVLERVNGALQPLDVDLFRHRALHDDAGDPGIGIHGLDCRQHFRFADVFREMAFVERDAEPFGCPLLVAHIDGDGVGITDHHGDKARRPAPFRQFIDGFARVLVESGGDPASVKFLVFPLEFIGHERPPPGLPTRSWRKARDRR